MSLRTDLIRLLHSGDVQRIRFSFGAARVDGRGYADVARCIENGHIQVVRSNTVPSDRAIYNRRFNCFVLGVAPSRALMVHEATHALHDWHHRAVTDVEDELAAYLAAMIYQFYENPVVMENLLANPAMGERGEAAIIECSHNPDACNGAVAYLMMSLAAAVIDGQPVEESQLEELRAVLRNDPEVRREGAPGTRSYDGILRQELPEEFLRYYDATIIAD